MDKSITYLSLNIEGDKHLALVEGLLIKHRPTIIALQEVYEENAAQLASVLGYAFHFESMMTMPHPVSNHSVKRGLSIMWEKSVVCLETKVHPYYTSPDAHKEKIQRPEPNACDRMLLVALLKQDEKLYRIINTHFIWTNNGEADSLQRDAMAKLMKELNNYNDSTGVILSGDFNAPRGKEMWGILAQAYFDNIPQEVITTLDEKLHRAKGLQFVVDGLFTTKNYTVTDVEVVGGVSDHMAILAKIA